MIRLYSFILSIFFIISNSQVGIGTESIHSSAALEVSATGGTGATATATMSGGVVTGLTLTNGGKNYTSPVTVTISGGGAAVNNGKNATATATVAANGTISGLTLTSGGSGYTSVPTVSISGGNKGVLLPRVDISNLSSTVTPINNPVDGLLVYNNNGSVNPKSLYFWNATASPSASWSRGIFYENTPKVAIVGFSGSPFFILDDYEAGWSQSLGDGRDTYQLFNGANIPRLGATRIGGTNSVFYVPPGDYTIEISIVLEAPAANPSTLATAIGTSDYYFMGYFLDVYVGTIDIATSTNAGGGIGSSRKETPVISKINDQHRVTWIYSYSLPSTIPSTQGYFFALNLGRMSGSSFNDGVNVIPTGSYVKISKY